MRMTRTSGRSLSGWSQPCKTDSTPDTKTVCRAPWSHFNWPGSRERPIPFRISGKYPQDAQNNSTDKNTARQVKYWLIAVLINFPAHLYSSQFLTFLSRAWSVHLFSCVLFSSYFINQKQCCQYHGSFKQIFLPDLQIYKFSLSNIWQWKLYIT